MAEITITQERYNELLNAEHTAVCLLNLIRQKHDKYNSISHSELELLRMTFHVPREEGGSRNEEL